MKKHMRAKCVVAAMLLSALLTGCGGEMRTLLPYKTVQHAADIVKVDERKEGGSRRLAPFSEGLCVIPQNYKQKKDAKLNTATSIVRVDLTDQSVVYSVAPYKRLYPASITKVVTALVVLRHGNLEDEVTVSYNAANITEVGAKKCGLEMGDKINMEVLLNSFLIYSGNDAGIAIAEHVAGSEEAFAEMMNAEAERLGATQSHFVNSHGLHDDKHYTSSYDIYLFMNELRNYDKFLEIVEKETYQALYVDKDGQEVKKTFESTNQFLTGASQVPEGVTILGGKTGTTDKAGSCLTLLTRDEDGRDYFSVILHATGGTVFPQMQHLVTLK